MAAARRPAQPLLVVLGSTGTGKSELAVELATRFRGEIINADAMQLYDGLPIITNKVTQEEQKGIPHHLLGHISLSEMPWDVSKYKKHATQVIQEIRDRGNLPILVGGTQYYVDPLLFKEVILDEVQADPSESFPILDEPTEVILAELKRVDPVMAGRWHPNDRRRIQRSLEIYLQSGRPASELYEEQKQRKAEVKQSSEEPQTWNNLMFWVYSEREVLKDRLDRRVDKMVNRGLLDEVGELLAFKQEQMAANRELDMTKGIWQSIGYPQFEPYMLAAQEGKDPAELDVLHARALEEMKVATRRYANYQTKWIRTKQIPLLKEQGPTAMENLYLLDSTDVSQFQKTVVEPAADLTAQFLNGEPRPLPTEISPLADEVLNKSVEPQPERVFCQRTCEICQVVLVTEQQWKHHVRGRQHRTLVKRKKKFALVPVESDASDIRPKADPTDLDMEGIFPEST